MPSRRRWSCRGLDPLDLAALHDAGVLVVVDNSTATPLGQRPLDLGADLVVASGTKALTGHADLLLGYVCTRSPDLAARNGWCTPSWCGSAGGGLVTGSKWWAERAGCR